MGDVLGGVFGGGQQQSQNTKPDATAQALNNVRLQQLDSLFSSQPYGSFAYSNPQGAFEPTAQTASLITNAFNNFAGGPGSVDTSNMLDLDEYIKLGLDSMQNYISQVAKPEIMSQATLQGLEYGGAPQEAIAKATAGIGLPFVQSLPGASSTLSLLPEQANLIRAQRGLTGVQQATSLFPLTDFTRQLKEQDINRQQGILTSGLTGLPFTPGSTVKGSTSSQPLFNFFGQG